MEKKLKLLTSREESGVFIMVPFPDTAMFKHVPGTSSATYYQIINTTLLNQEWNKYKDSVRTFYSDTVGKASFRPHKNF